MRRSALVWPLTSLLTLTAALALLLTAMTLFPPPAPPLALDAPTPGDTAPAVSVARLESAPDQFVTPLARTAPVVLPAAPIALVWARLIYPPGAAAVSPALPGPLLFVVEAGTLVARLDAPGRLRRATIAGADDDDGDGDCLGGCRLDVGDRLLLPRPTVVAVQNLGAGPAVLLTAGVVPAAIVTAGIGRVRTALGSAAPPRWDRAWSPGATALPLGGGWIVDLDAGTATLTLDRLRLEPGAHMTLPAGGAQALAVETGAVTLTTQHGLVWLHHPGEGDDWLGSDTPATLLGGAGALLQAGASARLRNDGGGPVQVLALTLMPAAAA